MPPRYEGKPTDAAVVVGETGGAGGEQVADLEDFHGAVGGEERVQGGHGVGLCAEGEFASGGGGVVALFCAVGVDRDDGLRGEVSKFAGGEPWGFGEHDVLQVGGVFGG